MNRIFPRNPVPVIRSGQTFPAASVAEGKRAICVVCAKDEASRIGSVLRVVCPMMETLVVDDGSTDNTSEVARSYGAHVLRLKSNQGKGRAMLEGIRCCSDVDAIVFADADLIGFQPEHVRALVDPVLFGDYGMVVGMRDHGQRYRASEPSELNRVVSNLPLISGERAIKKSILDAIPLQAWNGFGVETWLNHAVAAHGEKIGTVLLPGLHVVLKWEKEGISTGISKMADMGADIVRAHEDVARFYGIEQAPLPPSFTARNASSEEVLRSLSQAIVDASTPLVKDHLWTTNSRRELGEAIGDKLAFPLWTLTCTLCAYFFGPVAAMLSGASAVCNLGMSYSKRNGQMVRVPLRGF